MYSIWQGSAPPGIRDLDEVHCAGHVAELVTVQGAGVTLASMVYRETQECRHAGVRDRVNECPMPS
jgi:hypothetical protein